MDWLSITCKTVESENELKLEEEIEKEFGGKSSGTI